MTVGLSDAQISAIYNKIDPIIVQNKAARMGMDSAYAMRIAFGRAVEAALVTCKTCGGSKVDPGGLPVCRNCAAEVVAQPDLIEHQVADFSDLVKEQRWKQCTVCGAQDSFRVGGLCSGNADTYQGTRFYNPI